MAYKVMIMCFTIILITGALLWAAPPQGFRPAIGLPTQAPVDLKNNSTSPNNELGEKDLVRIEKLLGAIDHFLETGGKYTALFAEVTSIYKRILEEIVVMESHCKTNHTSYVERQTLFRGFYDASLENCSDMVTKLKQSARELSTKIDESDVIAQDFQLTLNDMVKEKRNMIIQRAIIEKDIQLRRSLQQLQELSKQAVDQSQEMKKR